MIICSPWKQARAPESLLAKNHRFWQVWQAWEKEDDGKISIPNLLGIQARKGYAWINTTTR
jgi:hypothetical protein